MKIKVKISTIINICSRSNSPPLNIDELKKNKDNNNVIKR